MTDDMLEDTWKDQARAWRHLFRDLTARRNLSHGPEVVAVEGGFRRLAEADAAAHLEERLTAKIDTSRFDEEPDSDGRDWAEQWDAGPKVAHLRGGESWGSVLEGVHRHALRVEAIKLAMVGDDHRLYLEDPVFHALVDALAHSAAAALAPIRLSKGDQ